MKKLYFLLVDSIAAQDKRLSMGAKLIHGHINKLSQRKGHCCVTNAFFAQFYKTSINSVSNWINQLIKYGYLKRELIYEITNKKIARRKLKSTCPLLKDVSKKSEYEY